MHTTIMTQLHHSRSNMPPEWLQDFARAHLLLSLAAALFVGGDIAAGRRQKMGVMNFVWPLTALWSGPLGLILYFWVGRPAPPEVRDREKQPAAPFPISVLKGTLHCGAGCVVGDFAGEWLVFLSGFTIAGSVLWANYAIDFALAFSVGIVFQYFAIAPMRNLSGWPGIKAALKADTISLIAYEIGMFCWMAYAEQLYHPKLDPMSPVYWYMMQIAMLAGLFTSYPANWILLKVGLKETM
jgi:hypothetical protein